MSPLFRRYGLVVFDLDGTLYHQAPVRRAMVRVLLIDALKRRSTRVIGCLRAYRAAREEGSGALDDAALRAAAAAEAGLSVGEADALITAFMHQRPLPHLARARVAGTAALFQALHDAGVPLAVWSDYPVPEKLAALGLSADAMVSAEDPAILAQKPDPAGLLHLMARFDTAPSDTLLIGDRLDRDGAASQRAGAAFVHRTDARRRSPAAIADFTDPRLHALTAARA
ncbi:MAG: HAD family hydrolase [Pseudomonadota bacterium]